MIDVEAVLQRLGIDYEEKGDEALGLCPMHKARTGKEDRFPSWWINLESGQHICFSCQYKGNVLQLICDVEEFYVKNWGGTYDYDYTTAKLWLSELEEVSPDKLMEILNSIPRRVQETPKPLEVSEANLAPFVDPPAEKLAERNISADSAREYGILWDKTRQAWILPFREPSSGKLIGWQEKGTLNRTFMNRPAGLPRSKTLFGLPQMNDSVVYIVESPLDCARLYTAGFPGAVAICGSGISEDQLRLIRYADRVIAAFDNPKVDDAGKKVSHQLMREAIRYGINLSFFNYGDTGKKDPGDLTNSEIAWGIENATSSLLGERAYV
jgi:hypothetical protein